MLQRIHSFIKFAFFHIIKINCTSNVLRFLIILMIPNSPVHTHFFNKNKNRKFINWKVHLTDGNTSVNEKPSFLGKDWALLYQLLKRSSNTKGTTFYPKDTAIQKYSNNNFRKTFVNK